MAIPVTLQELHTTIRELTFDRFVIPAFSIKAVNKDSYITVRPITEKLPNKYIATADGGDAIPRIEHGKITEEDVVVSGGDAFTTFDNSEENNLEYECPPLNPKNRKLYTVNGGNSEDVFKVEGGLEVVIKVEDKVETLVFNFSTYPTLGILAEALIEKEIVIAYAPYFKAATPSNELIKVTKRSLEVDFVAYRRYFFSDSEIDRMIQWYYHRVLCAPADITVNNDLVSQLKRPSEKHLCIWCAYYLVDNRRMYEQAAASIGQTYTDGSDYEGAVGVSNPSGITVQIGSVFTIEEKSTEGFFSNEFYEVGSDNTWGDRYSFWYRLMLYLRSLLEESFMDYSLRKNTVFAGQVDLVRDLDFRAYYDSYPFTISPLSRGILSKTP